MFSPYNAKASTSDAAYTPSSHDAIAEATAPRANLHRLFLMRNIAIAGQMAAIGVAVYGMGIGLPVGPMATIVGLLGGINLLTWQRLRQGWEPGEWAVVSQLIADVTALTALLYFAGGATNPFVSLLVLPLVVAAAQLPQAHTWAMAALTVGSYTMLMFYHRPLPYAEGGRDFTLHFLGMWMAFVVSAGLIAYFVARMAASLRERERSLRAAREQALQDERLVALGSLAAGTAHELATPLGTIALLGNELEEDYADDEELKPRLKLLRSQVERCKEALDNLSASAGQMRAEAGRAQPLDEYIHVAVAEWQTLRPGVQADLQLPESEAPTVIGERALTQALISILNNAADASPQAVTIRVAWDDQAAQLEVGDRGLGLNPEVSELLGRQPVSTKAPARGLGLGLFLAHGVVRRLGGEVQLFERASGGTCTRVTLPLSTLQGESHEFGYAPATGG